MSTFSDELSLSVMELARIVDLVNIRTVEFSARLSSDAPESIQELHAEIESQVRSGVLASGFLVEGQFKVTAKTTTGEPREFLELNYRVGAVYQVDAKPLPSTEVLNAFAASNGMVHLWPYVRAYVQQACAQLAVPVIVLPPFRVVPVRPTADAEKASKVNSGS